MAGSPRAMVTERELGLGHTEPTMTLSARHEGPRGRPGERNQVSEAGRECRPAAIVLCQHFAHVMETNAPCTAGIPALWVGEKSMKKKGRRQPFYPAPPFFKTFVPKSHVFKNSLPRASLFHRLFSDQESGNACRAGIHLQLTQSQKLGYARQRWRRRALQSMY